MPTQGPQDFGGKVRGRADGSFSPDRVLVEKVTIDMNNDSNISVHKPLYHFQYLKEVATLGKGEIFGELSLSTDKPRSATIICSETCEFAIMEKETYNKVVGNSMQKKLQERNRYLRQFRVLRSMNEDALT